VILLVAWRCRARASSLARNAGAVVADANQLASALLQRDLHAAGPGVETVLDQFLDHRGRPFDDLAGGDLVDEVVRQGLDRHAP